MRDDLKLEELFTALAICNPDSIKIGEVISQRDMYSFDLVYAFNKIELISEDSPKRSYKVFQDVKDALERCELGYFVGSSIDEHTVDKFKGDLYIDVILIPKAEPPDTNKNIRLTICFIEPLQVISEQYFQQSDPIKFLQQDLGYNSLFPDLDNTYTFRKLISK